MDGIISATHANTQMTHPPKGLKPNMHEKQRPACKVESSPSSNRARDTQIHMILWWLGVVFAFPSSHYCFCILTHVHLYVIIPSSLCACICRPSNQLILFPRACMCADLYSFVFSLKPVIVVDVMQLLRLRNKWFEICHSLTQHSLLSLILLYVNRSIKPSPVTSESHTWWTHFYQVICEEQTNKRRMTWSYPQRFTVLCGCYPTGIQ